ncbi:MAG: hypothetical protein K940chlam8_01180 [Chlamydiae bacterium]|nr:hypothetical protein [Chlamydiota bacterium]
MIKSNLKLLPNAKKILLKERLVFALGRSLILFFLFLSSCVFSIEGSKNLNPDVAKTKPSISILSLGALKLSGDVNVYTHLFSAKDNGVKIPRNTTSGEKVQTLIWELECNLYAKYFFKHTFAEANLRFDNDMGTQGGETGGIELHRAFMGYQFFDATTTHLDLIIGRRIISDLFESKVQYYYLTRIDGVYVDFHHAFHVFADVGFKGAGIVYNFKDQHYAYIVELSIRPLAAKGMSFKYSFTNWRKKGFSDIYDLWGNAQNSDGVPYGRIKDNPRYRFEISQWILGYNFHLNTIPINVYGAFLWNHAAKKSALFGFKKKNKAWYLGSKIGQMGEQNSYSFEFIYQNVEAQSVPDWDMAGVGTGNPRFNMIYGPAFDDFTGEQILVTQKNANGDVNFKGFEIDFQYAITKNIHLELIYYHSINEDKSIGPFRRFHDLEVAMHYFF